MNYRCLIIDDEPLAINILESYVLMVPTLELAGKCQNAFEAMKVLREQSIDIIFLDIQMPQLTGTDFLRSIRNPPKVIFTTAFKEFALEGFELDAVDYLLKPISLERFLKAINKIDNKAIHLATNENETAGVSGPPFLYFRTDRKMIKVFLGEILYIESLKDYIKIVREKDNPLVVKQSLSSVEEMLPKNKFLRIHRSFIVSSKKVKAFTKQHIEINGYEIPVGRIYIDQLKYLLQDE